MELTEDLLDIFELEGEGEKEIQCLSGGSKRKLRILSSLLGKPKYLFLDEPTNGIDV